MLFIIIIIINVKKLNSLKRLVRRYVAMSHKLAQLKKQKNQKGDITYQHIARVNVLTF